MTSTLADFGSAVSIVKNPESEAQILASLSRSPKNHGNLDEVEPIGLKT